MSEELELKLPAAAEGEQAEDAGATQAQSTPDTPEIEIIDDTPVEDRRPPRKGEAKIEDPKDEELPKRVQKRIGTLTYHVNEERRQREKAERERDEAVAWARSIQQQAQTMQNRANFGERLALESRHAQFEAEISKARADLKVAYEAGDAEKIADASARIAQISGQRAITPVPPKPDDPRMQPVAPPPPIQPQPRPPTQEEMALQQNTREWMAENASWFQRDQEMTNFAVQCDQALHTNGVIRGSTAYFNIINARLREVFPDRFDDDKEVPPVQPAAPQRKAPVVAPSTRSSASAGPRKFTLTKSQAAIADRLGVPYADYARELYKNQ